MSVIDFDRVSLTVGERIVLSEASFSIAQGEFIGVLGPNGAGKTTLMRSVLGLLQPTSGQISVFGERPERGDSRIGYLPQVRTVVPDLRVRGMDFIATSLNGERWGLPCLRLADRKRIDETLADIGARHLAERPLNEMSGGERQRLLLAQALLGKPQLLVLDEPLISLDARHQEVAIDVVRKICRKLKITVLFSAHELNQLMGSIDRVLYLGNQQAVLGRTEDVVTGPVLSKLYGADIQVIRAEGHVFVMSRGRDVERVDHLHNDHQGHHH